MTIATAAAVARVIYTNLRVLDEPRFCGRCIDSPKNRLPNGDLRPARYSVDESNGHTTFVGERYCERHLPSYLRRQLPRELVLKRYPRLLLAMQYAGILSQGEAIGAIRDLADNPRYGGAEAVVHYGGPAAVIHGALRCRSFVRRGVQSGRITPYRPCTECGVLTTAMDAVCSSKCSEKRSGADA
jgi:hypothetical protein